MEESYFDITCHEEQENLPKETSVKNKFITPQIKVNIRKIDGLA